MFAELLTFFSKNSSYLSVPKKKHQFTFLVKHPDNLPFAQEQIDCVRKAMQEARDDACKHMKNSWEALGNYQGGTVITESIELLKSLRAAERLDKEACFMENANIDYYNNRK